MGGLRTGKLDLPTGKLADHRDLFCKILERPGDNSRRTNRLWTRDFPNVHLRLGPYLRYTHLTIQRIDSNPFKIFLASRLESLGCIIMLESAKNRRSYPVVDLDSGLVRHDLTATVVTVSVWPYVGPSLPNS